MNVIRTASYLGAVERGAVGPRPQKLWPAAPLSRLGFLLLLQAPDKTSSSHFVPSASLGESAFLGLRYGAFCGESSPCKANYPQDVVPRGILTIGPESNSHQLDRFAFARGVH